jgi:hypothetical protein
MSKILRTTRECPFGGLDRKLLSAFREFFREHDLGEPAEETVLCCETVTERGGLSRLAAWLDGSPDTTERLGLVLTRKSLVWGHAGDRSDAKVFGIGLKDLRVVHYKTLFSKNSWLELSGTLIGGKKNVHGDLGLGVEEPAVRFCQRVVEEAGKAKPPRKKRSIPWLNWFGRKDE